MLRNFYSIRSVVFLAVFSLIAFIVGFVLEVGIGHPVLYSLLTIALFFKIIKVLYEWYHYVSLKNSKTPDSSPHPKKQYTVDMFTTACPGEPYEMFEETLKAMVNVSYPHKSYLCDEGNDPKLKKLCKELGVIHVTRDTHENAKAGNINNALKQSNGEICVIMDPDHVPYPEFLDHVLHPFDNPKVGYVQIVQAYKNQVETFVARAAAEQTYMFYGPMMEVMGEYGTAQAIGANCTFRRTALESIGGHAPGLTEDMHTSMLLHAKGWKSEYIPKVLSRGLVPTSLAAYYSQQLKWSRGTFDLWFNLYPKLFKNFTWRQKLHYGLMPVYYLFGLITLIDILIPSISLITGEYPWLLEPHIFFLLYLPFIICHLIVRLKAQKWVHDSHEYGLHLFGGILRVGTWWIYLIGFIYTIINVKVPYIPTPKKHTQKNEFRLGLPNLLISLFCAFSVFIGLKQDWQPYSMIMAIFAGSNAIIFFTAFVIGQSRWVFAIRNTWKGWKTSRLIGKYEISYHKLSKWAVPFIILLLIASSSFLIPLIINDDEYLGDTEKSVFEKEIGGFYTGIHFHESPFIEVKEKFIGVDKNWSIISSSVLWSDINLPTDDWEAITANGQIPFISWEPVIAYSNTSEEEFTNGNQQIFKQILKGNFDSYIDEFAISIRALGAPVFILFAREMDNPLAPWSIQGNNSGDDFVKAYRYVFERFEKLGVQNVTWVWSPSSPDSFTTHFPNGKSFPHSRFVDWIAISHQSSSFEEFQKHYELFLEKINELKIELPVLIQDKTSLENAGITQDQKSIGEIIFEIKNNYPEITAYVIQENSLNPRNEKKMNLLAEDLFLKQKLNFSKKDLAKLTAFGSSETISSKERVSPISGSKGNFNFQVDGEDFYIKGVCYSSGNEWREGFLPLTRKQLEEDFGNIKKMGANTIRRYEPSVYDRNITKIAHEKGLKVMYGFWFDPEVDYHKDEQKLKRYEQKVLRNVSRFKDDKSIIAWNIGNETWGLLKKHYAKPYLTINRRAYLEFLERLAQKIKQIDPTRPIFTSEEHEYYQFYSTIYELSAHAPSLDVIGINSYYRESVETLNEVFLEFDSLRPYVITEFGPKGYWSKEFGDYWNDSILLELPSVSKADWITDQWKNIFQSNKGYNLGAMVFSWRDRYEGTATWFGITDYQGRLKPTYYHLQQVWSDHISKVPEFPSIEIVGHWFPISPDNTIWMTAATTNFYDEKLKYEWKVVSNYDWKDHTKILESVEDNKFVQLSIPNPKPNESFRVYVYALDENNNSITASRALLIQN